MILTTATLQLPCPLGKEQAAATYSTVCVCVSGSCRRTSHSKVSPSGYLSAFLEEQWAENVPGEVLVITCLGVVHF